MTDRETLDRARLLFVGDTQGDMLAREVIAIAERLIASEEARVASRVNEMLARTEELRRSIAKCKP